MGEWSTYALEDFLMFSPRTFYRLLERHNEELWPWHVAVLAAAVVLVALLVRRDRQADRAAAALVALGWLGAAWLWLAGRFAAIQTGGRAMVAFFVVEAVLVAWAGVARHRIALPARLDVASRAGVAILLFGLLAYPGVARLAGRPWGQAELFGLTADPTAVATLGLFLATRAPWWLWPIPVTWAFFTGMMQWAMQAPEWWVSPATLLVGAVLAAARWRRPSRATPSPPA